VKREKPATHYRI